MVAKKVAIWWVCALCTAASIATANGVSFTDKELLRRNERGNSGSSSEKSGSSTEYRGKKGSTSGKKGSTSGKKGSASGKKGSTSGKKGSTSGKKGSTSGKKGSSSGKTGSTSGKKGSSSGSSTSSPLRLRSTSPTRSTNTAMPESTNDPAHLTIPGGQDGTQRSEITLRMVTQGSTATIPGSTVLTAQRVATTIDTTEETTVINAASTLLHAGTSASSITTALPVVDVVHDDPASASATTDSNAAATTFNYWVVLVVATAVVLLVGTMALAVRRRIREPRDDVDRRRSKTLTTLVHTNFVKEQPEPAATVAFYPAKAWHEEPVSTTPYQSKGNADGYFSVSPSDDRIYAEISPYESPSNTYEDVTDTLTKKMSTKNVKACQHLQYDNASDPPSRPVPAPYEYGEATTSPYEYSEAVTLPAAADDDFTPIYEYGEVHTDGSPTYDNAKAEESQDFCPLSPKVSTKSEYLKSYYSTCDDGVYSDPNPTETTPRYYTDNERKNMSDIYIDDMQLKSEKPSPLQYLRNSPYDAVRDHSTSTSSPELCCESNPQEKRHAHNGHSSMAEPVHYDSASSPKQPIISDIDYDVAAECTTRVEYDVASSSSIHEVEYDLASVSSGSKVPSNNLMNCQSYDIAAEATYITVSPHKSIAFKSNHTYDTAARTDENFTPPNFAGFDGDATDCYIYDQDNSAQYYASPDVYIPNDSDDDAC